MDVITSCGVEVIDDPAEIEAAGSPLGKPFIRLTMPNGQRLDITTNLAEMLGGVGAGARHRWEVGRDAARWREGEP